MRRKVKTNEWEKKTTAHVCVCALDEWQKLVAIREATTTCVLKTSNTNARVRHVPCGRQRVMVGAMQSYESTPNATARAKEAEQKKKVRAGFMLSRRDGGRRNNSDTQAKKELSLNECSAITATLPRIHQRQAASNEEIFHKVHNIHSFHYTFACSLQFDSLTFPHTHTHIQWERVVLRHNRYVYLMWACTTSVLAKRVYFHCSKNFKTIPRKNWAKKMKSFFLPSFLFLFLFLFVCLASILHAPVQE